MVRDTRSSLSVDQAKRQLQDDSASQSSMTDVITDCVRKHPLESALVAGAAGVVLGYSSTARRAVTTALPMLLLKYLK